MPPARTAVILPGGDRIDLVVPLTSGGTLNSLKDLALKRAAQHHPANISDATDVLFRLDGHAGPFLDADDRVEDVVSTGETVFLILKRPSMPAASLSSQEDGQCSSHTNATASDGFQVRVITTHLAHCHEDVRTIPLLENGKVFSQHATLSDLKSSIAGSLGMTVDSGIFHPRECNCKMAEIISERPVASVADEIKILVFTYCRSTQLKERRRSQVVRRRVQERMQCSVLPDTG
jgi:hypothetical protein